MYHDRYFEIQRLLDEVLGTEDGDGAGEGIAADVALALTRAQQRGAVKALRAEAARGMEAIENAAKLNTPNRDFALALMRGLAQELQHRADLIESGEATP
jgi:hypothetical protein